MWEAHRHEDVLANIYQPHTQHSGSLVYIKTGTLFYQHMIQWLSKTELGQVGALMLYVLHCLEFYYGNRTEHRGLK